MPTPQPQAATAAANPLLSCPHCALPMRALALSSHTGTPSMVDLCSACRLVWFDELESVRLDGLGWVRLLREMQHAAGASPALPAPAAPPCPRCRAALRPARNATRWGRFVTLACPQGHGHLQSHVALLAERGLVRPLGVAERRALRDEQQAIHCVNCGGTAGAGDDACRWCGTPLAVLDLPRLAHSLLPRDRAWEPAPQQAEPLAAWACRGCGAALDAGRHAHCPHCGHLVVSLALPDLATLLDAAERQQLAHASAVEQVRARWRQARNPAGGRAAPDAVRGHWLTSRPGALGRPRWMLGGWAPLLAALAIASTVAALGPAAPPAPASPRPAAPSCGPRDPCTDRVTLEQMLERTLPRPATTQAPMSLQRQAGLASAAALLAFMAWCFLARRFGERRTLGGAALALAVASLALGRGLDVAAVLIVPMAFVAGLAVLAAVLVAYRVYASFFFPPRQARPAVLARRRSAR